MSRVGHKTGSPAGPRRGLQARRRRAAIARLGQIALRSDSLETLLRETAGYVAEGLGLKRAAIFEILSGSRLALRAGAGWPENSGASAADSHVVYTLAARRPVIVRDFRSESRFEGGALFRDQGVVSGLAVPVPGERGPCGAIAAYASRPRAFTEDDVHFVEAAANILAGWMERHRTGEALRRSNRMLYMLSRCNEALPRAAGENDFLHEVCRLVVEAGYQLAWIGFAEEDGEKTVRPVARAGRGEDYIGAISVHWGEDAASLGPTGTAIRTGKPAIARHIAEDPSFAPWREQALARGFASSIALPLTAGERVFGALNIYAGEPDAFDAEEIQLLANLASDVSSGILALRDRAERARAEAMLAERERYFRALIENAMDLITVLDRDRTIRYQSPSAQRVLGYLPQELCGRSVFDFVHPEDAERARQAFAVASADDNGLRSGFRVLHKDGSWRYLETIGKRLAGPGAFRGVIINSRDVTDRKNTERLLQESEENLRQLTDNIREVFWLTNRDRSDMIYVSPAYESIWGRTREALYDAPASWMDAIHPEDRPRVEAATLGAGRGEAYDEEYRVVRPDGSVRWVRDRAFPIHDGSGAVYRVAGVAEDVTEQRRADEAVRSSYRELQTLHEINRGILNTLELKPILNLILQKTLSAGAFDLGLIRLLDPAGKRMEVAAHHGYRNSGNIHDRLLEPAGAGRKPTLYRVLQTKKTLVVEDLTAHDGLSSLKLEEARSAVLVPISAEDEVLGIMLLGSRSPRAMQEKEIRLLEAIGSQTGLAIQKARLYDQVKEQVKELERSNRVKSEFLGVMSHELKTPLNIILGYASVVRDDLMRSGDEAHGAALKKIEFQANELLRMINSIMEAVRLESGDIVLDLGPVDVERLMEELKLAVDVPQQKPVRLIWRISPGLPPLRTDRLRLAQILRNLIANALKFTDSGSVTVSAAPGGGAGTAPYVEFSVKDTGIGVPEESLSEIFDMFHQLDSSTTRSYEGAGLGLHIVKKFTALLGGTVAVESAPGKGSTFTVRIPSGGPTGAA
ncbi:MAG TPA: GAF domain-containing protein [candidate division Zixibacteria bacterium]|nr:GAF domain-containing protein [candidate division Zixibacteria bacterium]